MGRYLPTGIVKGLGVTGGTMLRTIFPDPKKPIPNPVKGADTVQYPHEGSAANPSPRCDRPARGELHGVHAVRSRVPGLVHLHRGP